MELSIVEAHASARRVWPSLVGWSRHGHFNGLVGGQRGVGGGKKLG